MSCWWGSALPESSALLADTYQLHMCMIIIFPLVFEAVELQKSLGGGGGRRGEGGEGGTADRMTSVRRELRECLSGRHRVPSSGCTEQTHVSLSRSVLLLVPPTSPVHTAGHVIVEIPLEKLLLGRRHLSAHFNAPFYTPTPHFLRPVSIT